MNKNHESIFWDQVHEHITSSTTLPNNRCKYKICHIKENNDSSKYLDVKSSNIFVKESRFSYIRPVDGDTRLIVYNCSNITGLEQRVHRGSKVVGEVPDSCMVVFTNHAIHAGVKTYEKQGGVYSSHLRMFAYIVEKDYIQTEGSITTMLADDKCHLSCATCEPLVNENIHHEGHVIRYLKSKCDIENLFMCTVLLGNLEKVGWVVLKYDFAITVNSREQNDFYYLNNKIFKKTEYRWNSIHKKNRKMFTILMRIRMNKDFFKRRTFKII